MFVQVFPGTRGAAGLYSFASQEKGVHLFVEPSGGHLVLDSARNKAVRIFVTL
jgi:hypothetical protein